MQLRFARAAGTVVLVICRRLGAPGEVRSKMRPRRITRDAPCCRRTPRLRWRCWRAPAEHGARRAPQAEDTMSSLGREPCRRGAIQRSGDGALATTDVVQQNVEHGNREQPQALVARCCHQQHRFLYQPQMDR